MVCVGLHLLQQYVILLMVVILLLNMLQIRCILVIMRVKECIIPNRL